MLQHLFYNGRIALTIGTFVKFIIDNFLWVAVALVSGGALLWPVLTGRGKKASPLEATLLLNRGKSMLLDVRETAEFAAAHIRDAKHIPLGELEKRIGELEKSKTKTIVVVCQSGARSAKAVAKLAQAGFDAVSLEGGLAAWQAQGLPVTK